MSAPADERLVRALQEFGPRNEHEAYVYASAEWILIFRLVERLLEVSAEVRDLKMKVIEMGGYDEYR